jgi:hypothetical protein
MKKLTTSLGLILALLLLNAAMPQKAAASAGYLENAERYTVKIRTRVKYPSREDKKGSFSGAGFLIDSKRGWIATNAHVTSRNPESVEIAFKDKAFTDAKLIFLINILIWRYFKSHSMISLKTPKQQNSIAIDGLKSRVELAPMATRYHWFSL